MKMGPGDLVYPVELARRGNHTDHYKNGKGEKVSVVDPYRELEDPDSEATRKWVDAENKLS